MPYIKKCERDHLNLESDFSDLFVKYHVSGTLNYVLTMVCKAYLKRNFEIYYPVKHKTIIKLKTDPIIVGYRNSKMVQIFHWDDGKLYE